MKIVYMGTPDFAVPALQKLYDEGHQILRVVTRPDARRSRGKKVLFSPVKEKALELGIDVMQPERIKGNDDFIRELEALGPDVIVVAAYGMILPQSVLDIPAKGCINIHGSLLPRFRGAAPIQAAILAGDEKTGITIMEMEAGLDTGDMLLKGETEIGDKTGEQLHDELALMGADLIADALARLDELVPQPQDDALSTYAPMISKADGKADFSKSPEQLERQMRAFDPWPGTFAMLGDQQIKLWRAEALEKRSDAPAGTVLAADPEGIDVACGGRVLRIKSLQLPGRRRVSADEYLRGNTIEIGTVLG